MKLKCNGLALSEAVNKVTNALPVKKNNTYYEGIKLTVSGNYLTLTATDQDLTIIKRIEADIKIEGEVLVYGSVFAQYVRSINNSYEQIELECTDGKTLTLRYGDNSVDIKCMNVSAYPLIEEVQAITTLELKKDDLKELIKKTVFAAAVEDGRPVLKGCLFEINNKELTVVSLDGYRLSLCRKEIVSVDTAKQNFLIPARSLSEIAKFIDEAEDTVKIAFSKDKLSVDINNTIIISRLIIAEFVNYRNIIPTGFTTRVSFNKNSFQDSIARATIMTKAGKNNLVKLEIKEESVLIDAISDMGHINETIPAYVEGKDTVMFFNGTYLLDFLKTIEEEEISMNIKTNNSPCIFTQTEGNDYLFLVLPMKVNY